MSCEVDSPIQTQMAVSVLNRTVSSDYCGNRTEGQRMSRRHLFVQTSAGCALGNELDLGDNPHTVKRKLQLSLNFPIEKSSLNSGHHLLENENSSSQHEATLFLTKSILQRSSSTPCLLPSGKDIEQRDLSGPIEILGCSTHCSWMKQLIMDVVKAMKSGVEPIPVQSGLGGTYYFRNSKGESIAIVKPADEEPFAPNNPKGFVGKTLGQPGLKRSVRVGETGFREVAAYLLDYDHFAKVPPTVLVNISHSVFHFNERVYCNTTKIDRRKQRLISKIASFQQYVAHDFDASDHGTSSFPVTAVHRIGILDVRIFNTDRHAGNILVRKVNGGAGGIGGQMELIPIDHGFCLPENLEDPYFEWIHWPQASVPFSHDELEYIANLDPVRDSNMLLMELPMIRGACLRILVLCTIFLKEAAGFGLCLAEIGEMMSREFRGTEEEPSELELVCIEARRCIARRESFFQAGYVGNGDDFQFNIDCEDDLPIFNRSSAPYHVGFNGRNLMYPLLELDDECNGKSNMEVVPCFSTVPRLPKASSLSVSLKGVSLTERSKRFQVGISKGDTSQDKHTSGGVLHEEQDSSFEKLQTSVSFVKLEDMGEEEWDVFLEKFHELLYDAFCTRKSVASGQRQSLRLGTSCQF